MVQRKMLQRSVDSSDTSHPLKLQCVLHRWDDLKALSYHLQLENNLHLFLWCRWCKECFFFFMFCVLAAAGLWSWWWWRIRRRHRGCRRPASCAHLLSAEEYAGYRGARPAEAQTAVRHLPEAGWQRAGRPASLHRFKVSASQNIWSAGNFCKMKGKFSYPLFELFLFQV